jgi:hypothetical protein
MYLCIKNIQRQLLFQSNNPENSLIAMDMLYILQNPKKLGMDIKLMLQ